MTAADRAQLRQVILTAQQMREPAGQQQVIDRALAQIDARLTHAQQAADRSNRARGTVRQMTQRRQALLAKLHARQQERVGAELAAEQARQDLIAGSRPDLAGAVVAARQHLDDARWHADALPATATLADQVRVQEQLRIAQDRHDAAVQAAVAWDP